MAEDAVSLLTSYFEGGKSQRDFLQRRDSILANHPELIESLNMTSREKRNASRSFGITRQTGQIFAELPLAKLDLRIWLPHLNMIGKKLALAIHYRCHLRPMPLGSAIYLLVNTNADFMHNPLLNEMLEMAPQLVMPMRNREMLGGQFALRWGASTELGGTTFVASIQKKLIISALCVENPTIIGNQQAQDRAEKPFEW